MNIISKFWERQSIWIAKIKGYATFLGVLCATVGWFSVDNYKTFGSTLLCLSFWCFGLVMVYELWHVDEHGDSKMRNSSPFAQLYISIFYLVWFSGLTYMTIAIYAIINS